MMDLDVLSVSGLDFTVKLTVAFLLNVDQTDMTALLTTQKGFLGVNHHVCVCVCVGPDSQPGPQSSLIIDQ